MSDDYRNHIRLDVRGGKFDHDTVHAAFAEVFSVAWAKGERIARDGGQPPARSAAPADATTDYAARVTQHVGHFRGARPLRTVRLDVKYGVFVRGSLTAALADVREIGLAAGYDAACRAGLHGVGGATEHEKLVYEHLQSIRGRARA